MAPEAVGSKELAEVSVGWTWPETCPECGADLVAESWIEVYVRGPVLVTSVLPGGQLDTVHVRQEPDSAGVRVACGYCLADLTGHGVPNGA